MEHKDALTPLESRLVECAAAGEELDCAPTGATAAELDEIEDWDERRIRAWVLVALCTGEVPDWSVHPRRGLRLRGAKVVGRVDLSRAQLSECPLAFHTCCFSEGVSLFQTTTAEVSFTSCRLPSLHGDTLNSSASLSLTKTALNRISLMDASFRGSIELSKVRLDNPDGIALNCQRMSAADLSLRHTNVEGEVSLEGAQIRGVVNFLEDTRLEAIAGEVNTSDRRRIAINGDRLNTGEVIFRKTHVEGEVSLLGANISAQLICREARLINPEGSALSGDGMSATSVFLRGGTHVEGVMRLLGANISGTLECSERTELINSGEDRVALFCSTLKAGQVDLHDAHIEGLVALQSAQISGHMRLYSTYVKGTVNLQGAQISGDLRISGGDTYDSNTKLINPGSVTLNCEDLKAANVFLQNTHVEGQVNLWSAQLSSDFYCRWQTQLHNRGDVALSAQGCQVEGKLLFWLPQAAVGTIDLARAKVGALDDDLESWPGTINLEGFSYHSLGGDENLDRRLSWISKSKPFSPHVYTQLAEVYRRSGQEGFARQVAIRREKERGRQPDLSPWVRAWNRFLGLTVAYGYQPWRALAPLVVLFLLGWLAFSLPAAQQVMVHAPHNITGPISATACHKNYPCFFPAVYALDTLLPIVDLHQESNWVPASHRPWGVWYEVLSWVLIAAGWILTTAVVAGIGSLWRRE